MIRSLASVPALPRGLSLGEAPATRRNWAYPSLAKTALSLRRKGDREPVGEGMANAGQVIPGPEPLERRKKARQTSSAVPSEVRVGARVVPFNLGYALWAATYDRQPNPLLALEERVLQPRLPDLRRRTVLDVGCGTGRWLVRLLQRGARRGVGVDLSTEMLQYAASRGPQSAWLARADALALPLRPKTMDLIICSFTLGHIENLSRLASELARVARRRADVYLSGLHPEARARGWRCAFRHGGETIEIPEFNPPLEAVSGFFSAVGFKFVSLLEPHFGSEERLIFVSAGKAEQFERATTVPAIFVCQFRRR